MRLRETPSSPDDDQPDPGHHEGHADAEGDHEHDPECGSSGGDRPEKDQERAGRRDDPARQTEDEQAAPGDRRPGAVGRVTVADPAVAVFVGVAVMVMIVAVGGRGRLGPSADLADQHPGPDREDRERSDDRCRPDEDVRVQDALRADDQARECEDPDGV